MGVTVAVHYLICSYTAKRKSVPINVDRRVVLTPFIPLQEWNRNHESFMRKEVGWHSLVTGKLAHGLRSKYLLLDRQDRTFIYRPSCIYTAQVYNEINPIGKLISNFSLNFFLSFPNLLFLPPFPHHFLFYFLILFIQYRVPQNLCPLW